MERTIVITGEGKLSANPDLTIIKLPVKTENLDYGTAVDELNKLVNQIRDAIASLGLDREELKTQDFRVDTLTRWKTKTSEEEFLGYSAKHDLILEIPFDNNLTNRIITNIVKIDSNVGFNIGFGVQDKETYIQSLIENAIKDAKGKAKIIAEASDVKLKEILNINYSFSTVHFRSDTDLIYDSNDSGLIEESVPDINPTDIDMSKNVTMTWRIE